MSKILKLLNKANKTKDGGYAMAVSNNEATIGPADYVRDDYNNGHAEEGAGDGYRMPVVPFVAISVIAFISLFISFSSLRQLNASKQHLLVLSSKYQKQQEKTVAFEAFMSELKQHDAKYLNRFNEEILNVRSVIEQSKMEMDELNTEQSLLKLTLDDLKVTDRLLLDKIITISQSVKDVKNSIIEEERELSYGKNN